MPATPTEESVPTLLKKIFKRLRAYTRFSLRTLLLVTFLAGSIIPVVRGWHAWVPDYKNEDGRPGDAPAALTSGVFFDPFAGFAVHGNGTLYRAVDGTTISLKGPVEKNFSQLWTRFSPDGRMLISCSGSGQVSVWDTRTGSLLNTRQLNVSPFDFGGGPSVSVNVSPDTNRFAVFDSKTAFVLDYPELKLIATFPLRALRPGDYRAMPEFLRGGGKLCSLEPEGMDVYELPAGKLLHTVPAGIGPCVTLTVPFPRTRNWNICDSPGRLFAVSSLETGEVLQGPSGPAGVICDQRTIPILSLDEKLVSIRVIENGSPVYRFYDIPAMTLRYTIRHPDALVPAYFSSDSRRCYLDYWVLDAATGALLEDLEACGRPSFEMELFWPDGNRMIELSRNTTWTRVRPEGSRWKMPEVWLAIALAAALLGSIIADLRAAYRA